MSDRPMLLKYLTTKMKIILCIFLLCITEVSVFGQSVELNGVKNKSIEFPAAVETGGSLMYGGKVIGRVVSRTLLSLTTPEYQGRVQWDSSTGRFSLSGLRLEDSGVYKVEKDDGQKSVSTFSLTVWKDNVPVSKPNVSIIHNEYPCTIECTAERGTGVTLSWYREGEKKPYVSSRVASAPHLHLPKTVERSGTYTCEAKNSVSNEKASITVGAHCTAPTAERELNSILAGSVKFPAAVKINGFLMYSGVPIGDVDSSTFTAPHSEKFSGRVHWNSSTGLFSLSELKMEDSGVYTVQNTQQTSVSTFNLTVWEDNVNVSKPHLSVTRNEYRCTVLCAAARGTGVTLTLYKNGEKKPYVTSPGHSHPHLDMTQTVESGTYTCEAKNSVSRNTSDPLTVGAHCTAGPSTGEIVGSVIAAVAILIAVVFAVLYWRNRSNHPDETSSNRNHELGTKGEDLNPLGNDKLLSHLNSP